ncbi:MAG: T9SS type A sorting domain-containing protein [Bacteroidetes bacterium]|nr:T9SS type A sorting domain-containing protein [Bacteroidota bacterium]
MAENIFIGQGENSVRINTSGFASGIYLLHIKNEYSSVISTRFIVWK